MKLPSQAEADVLWQQLNGILWQVLHKAGTGAARCNTQVAQRHVHCTKECLPPTCMSWVAMSTISTDRPNGLLVIEKWLPRPIEVGQLGPPHCPSKRGTGAWLGMFICWAAADWPGAPGLPKGVAGIIMASLMGITPCRTDRSV